MSAARPPVHVTAPRRVFLALAGVCLVAAVAIPGWSGPVARAVLVIAGTVVAAAGAVTLVRSLPFASTSRFQPSAHQRERRDVPPELETLIKSVNESSANERQLLTPTVLLHLRRVAVARLKSMRLDVDDPADHRAIQHHVSLTMWAVLAPGPATGRAQHLPSLEIPATSLPALLDELEQL